MYWNEIHVVFATWNSLSSETGQIVFIINVYCINWCLFVNDARLTVLIIDVFCFGTFVRCTLGTDVFCQSLPAFIAGSEGKKPPRISFSVSKVNHLTPLGNIFFGTAGIVSSGSKKWTRRRYMVAGMKFICIG